MNLTNTESFTTAELLSDKKAGLPLSTVFQNWKLWLLIAIVAALYGQILGKLLVQWFQDPNYGHGIFVPIFSGYLIWRKRVELNNVPLRPSSSGLLVLLFSLCLLFLGSLGAELFLTRISLLGVIVGLILCFAGASVLRLIAFPIAFLVLMVPLPAIIYNQIVFPLQLIASQISTTCLQRSAIVPVLREGNVLILPDSSLEVVEACSGIRSLMTLVTLGLAYAYVLERRLIWRSVLVIAMVPIAVLANAARVMMTALLVVEWGPTAAEGFWHSVSGLVIFFLATLALLGLHALIKVSRRRLQQDQV